MIETRAFLHDAKTALVIIDLQRGIVGREVVPHSGSEVLASAARLVQAFRNAQLPVAFVRVSFTPEATLKPLLDNPQRRRSQRAGTNWRRSSVHVRTTRFVTKKNWGAFYGTDLDLQLRRRDVTRIAICGISTSIGVESTARDAFERNYKLLFVEDAMAAMTAAEHEYACSAIFSRMGIIRSTDQVVQPLS